MLGKTESKGRSGQERMRWLDNITVSMDMNLTKFWETEIKQDSYTVSCRSSNRGLQIEKES